MSIFGTAIISLTKSYFGPSSMTKRQDEGGQCLPTIGANEGESPQSHHVQCTTEKYDEQCLLTAGVNEGGSPQQHRVQCTKEKGNDGLHHHTPDITALCTVIRLYYSSTLSELSNHPIYMMIIRLFFHSVMLSSYCGGLLWEWTQRELSLWTFYSLSYVCPLAKLLLYMGIVIKTAIQLILSSIYCKKVHLSKKGRFREPSGYCRRKMILSAYMHSWEWTGYLKKLNREPILMADKIHSIGLKGLFLFGLLCASSVEAVHNRRLAISSSLRWPFQNNIKVPMYIHNKNTAPDIASGFPVEGAAVGVIDGYVIENAPVGIDDGSSVIQKNKFKLADIIDPTEYPDAFTDNSRLGFLSQASDYCS